MELSNGTDLFDDYLLSQYDPDEYLQDTRSWWAILPQPPDWVADFVRRPAKRGRQRYEKKSETFIRIESAYMPDGQRVLIKTLPLQSPKLKSEQYKRNYLSITKEVAMGRFLTQHTVSPHLVPFLCAYIDQTAQRFVSLTSFCPGPLIADYYAEHCESMSLARFAALQFQTWFTVVATARRLRMLFDDRHGANRVAMTIAPDHLFYNRPWAYEVAEGEYMVLAPQAHGNLFVCDFDYDFVQDGVDWEDARLAEGVREALLQTMHYPNGQSEHEKSYGPDRP